MSDCLSVRLSHRFAGIITFTAMRASWVEKGGREDGAGGGKRVYPTATISTHFEMHERRGEWVQRSLKEREEWRERGIERGTEGEREKPLIIRKITGGQLRRGVLDGAISNTISKFVINYNALHSTPHRVDQYQ